MNTAEKIRHAIEKTSPFFMADEIKKYAEDFVREYSQIGDSPLYKGKHCGSKAEQEGSKYIYTQLKKIGLQAELLPFETTKFQFNDATITLPDGSAPIKPYACLTYPTAAGGITAEVVDVGKGDKEFYETHDIKGKIALIETKEDFEDGTVVGSFQMYEAEANGAAGIILYTDTYIYDRDTIRATYSLFDVHIPNATVSYNDAMRIKAYADMALAKPEDENLKVTMEIDSEYDRTGGTSYNVMGILPGRTDEYIVYSCHLDHFFYGVQDNVSSISTLLGIAKAMKESGYEPERNIVFLFTASHEIGKVDSAAPDILGAWTFYNKQKPELLGKTIVDINFEYGGLHTDNLRVLMSQEMKAQYSDFVSYMPDKSVKGLGPVIEESSPEDYYLLTWADSIAAIMGGIPLIMNDTIYDQIYMGTSPYMGRDHTNMDDMKIYDADANLGSIYWYGCLGIYMDNIKSLITDYENRAEYIALKDEEVQFLNEEGIDYSEFEKQRNLFKKLGTQVTAELKKANSSDRICESVNSKLLEIQKVIADVSDGLTTAAPCMLEVPHCVYIAKGILFRKAEEELEKNGYEEAFQHYLRKIDAVSLGERFGEGPAEELKEYVLGKNATWNKGKARNFFLGDELREDVWREAMAVNLEAVRASIAEETQGLKKANKLFVDLLFDLMDIGVDTMMEYVRKLTFLPHRKTGTAEGRQAADITKFEFEALGYDAILEEFPSNCWELKRCSLTVQGEDIECFIANGTNRQGETGVFSSDASETDIIYLGKGDAADFNGTDVTGKLVLCDIDFLTSHPSDLVNWAEGAEMYDPRGLTDKPLNKYDIYTPNNWPFNYKRAMEGGAAGFIGILNNYMDCHYYNEDYNEIVHMDTFMELPAVWISRQDGLKLIDKIKALGGAVKASLDVCTEFAWKPANVVSAKLQGKSDEMVLVHSHHDAISQGAVQDASGWSVIMALGKFFRELNPELREKTITLLSTDTHFTDYEGQSCYVEKHLNDGDRILYDFTIEHMAKEMELDENNGMIIHDEAESRMLYVDKEKEGLLQLVKEAVEMYDYEKTCIIPVGKSEGDYTKNDVCSDSYDFNAAGIPVVSVVCGPMYLFHPSDTIDKIHPESMEKTMKMYAYIILNCIN